MARHAVDPHRVYLTGMSNGAMMAYRVALERPERVAAIAPVAGAMALDPDLVRVPVPVLHMHGTDDRHAPFEGGVGSASIEGGGHTWPGSTARERWLGPSTLDVDANELMWAYFEPRTAAP